MTKPRSNQPGDVVLLHFEGKPAIFARIEDIRPQGRPGWFLCDLLLLMPPGQPITWILRREQIDGEPFTMGGNPVEIHSLPPLGAAHAAAARDLADRPETIGVKAEGPMAVPPGAGPGERGTVSPGPGGLPKDAPQPRVTSEKDKKVLRLVPREKKSEPSGG